MVTTALIELLRIGVQEVKAQAVKALANLALDGLFPALLDLSAFLRVSLLA